MKQNKQKKEITTIQLSKDTKKDLSILKINSNAKNLDAVVKEMIAKLNKEIEK